MKYTTEQLEKYEKKLEKMGYCDSTFRATCSGLKKFDLIARGEITEEAKEAALAFRKTEEAKLQLLRWIERFEKWLKTGEIEENRRTTTKQKEDSDRLAIETEIAELAEGICKQWRRKKKEEWRQNAILRIRNACGQERK